MTLAVAGLMAIPLLRAHFYCTETETHRLRVFYYRKGNSTPKPLNPKP